MQLISTNLEDKLTYKVRNLRFVFALLTASFAGAPMMQAETLRVGDSQEYTDVCTAIAAAEPGDVIEVHGSAAAGQCAWNTSGLTIK